LGISYGRFFFKTFNAHIIRKNPIPVSTGGSILLMIPRATIIVATIPNKRLIKIIFLRDAIASKISFFRPANLD